MSETVKRKIKIIGCVLLAALLIGLTVFIYNSYDTYKSVDKSRRFETRDGENDNADDISQWGTLIDNYKMPESENSYIINL